MADPFDSPDIIQMKGTLTGVTRLSRKAKLLVVLVSFIVFGFIVFSIMSMNSGTDTTDLEGVRTTDQDPDEKKPAVQPAKPTFDGVGDGQAGVVAAQAETASTATQAGASSPNVGIKTQMNASGAKAHDNASQHSPVRLSAGTASGGELGAPPYQTPEEQAAAQALKESADRQRNAVASGLEMGGSGDSLSRIERTDMTAGAPSNQTSAFATAAQAAQKAQGGGVGPFVPASVQQQEDDQNKQGRKEQFLHISDTTPKTYLKELKQPPVSPFEIKAGWAIPAALECGLNSDLPGQTCARVTENVYDTATGRYLLIPQGTKVIGTYDSQIAYGQQRILAVWNRLIFPDASSIRLNGMPGEDEAGYAGFDAEVNNHYLKVFGGALLMAAFSAGIELTQKQNTSINGMPTNSQMISQSVGQQLGQTGAAYIQRGMNIQPTLTRAPGYKFNIVVTRDIVFSSAYKPQPLSAN